jgi:hypothetical protein
VTNTSKRRSAAARKPAAKRSPQTSAGPIAARPGAGVGGAGVAGAGAGVGGAGVESAVPVEGPTAAAGGGFTLRWGTRVLMIEAAALAVLTIISIWAAITSSNVSTSSAAATPAFAAIYAAVLGGLGYALSRRKALARGPAIVLEMLMLPMGYYMIVAGLGWLGVPTLIFGLAGSVLLLAPSTRTALGLR